MKRMLCWSAFVVIMIVASSFRLVALDRRPVHHDESNQIFKAGILQQEGDYRYDPDEHHGPTLYYFAMPFVYCGAGHDFSKTTIGMFRIQPALFGIALILLMLVIREGLGWGALLAGSMLTAVSSAMVYYSRFFIQETLLVLFTFGTIACGWKYFRSPSALWAVLTGTCIGLMHATKETCVLAYLSIAIALVVVILWQADFKYHISHFKILPDHLLYVVFTALVVSGVFFSSFFTYPPGIWDSFRTYLTYLGRGAGGNTDHVHSAFYYLHILLRYKDGGLVWSEAVIIVLAGFGVCAVLFRKGIEKMDINLLRFLVIYSLLMTLLYSMIPYKTPWCMLSFLHGLILLAGIGVASVYNVVRGIVPKLIWVTAVGVCIFILGQQSVRAIFRYCADERNPYAYAHTVSDYLRMIQRIEDIAKIDPAGKNMKIAVVTNPYDAWPLPWYLRTYSSVSYSAEFHMLEPGFNPVLIVASVEKEAELESIVKDKYQTEYWGLRPEVPVILYIRKDVWALFMETRQ